MNSKSLLDAALQAVKSPSTRARGIAMLDEVIERFPDSDSADLAKASLFRLRNPGEAEECDTPTGLTATARAVPADAVRRVILTTAESVPDRRIAEVIEVVGAECAFGTNFIADIGAGIRDIVGGRSGSTQGYLRDARKLCLYELRAEAAGVNADAVIAVRFAYSEISGGDKSMVFLVATGTAVRLE